MCEHLLPAMPYACSDYFKEKLKLSNVYLEFGSGGSTVLASNYVKDKIISIESDKEWYEKLKLHFNNNSKITLYLVDLYCKPMTWGHPSSICPIENKKLYSDFVKSIDITNVDLVLIDGRFRVACALKIHSLISDNTIVLFDDFEDRRVHYDVVLNYYNIIHIVDRMVHLQKKHIHIEDSIIKKYELQEI